MCLEVRFRLLLAVTIGLLLATVALTVVMYVFFGKDIACGLNIFFITFNFCLCIVVAICAVLPKVQDWNPKSGLLQAAVCVLYATYLVWSAILSQPSSSCNSLTGSTGASEFTIVLVRSPGESRLAGWSLSKCETLVRG